MKPDMTLEQRKLESLRRMRIIATSILALMALVYIVFKRFEAQHIVFGCIVAFSEAAMIGALADWFAVVALFRHPMGMKWIPHTAIIPRNKDRLGESISSFVVSNFFSEQVIRTRLEGIDLSSELASYLRKNKETIADSIITGLPGNINSIFENSELMELAGQELKKALKGVKLYPLLGSVLQAFVASGQHIPLTRELLVYLRGYISENKDGTLRFLEGLNKTFSLPLIGDIVYWNILKTLDRQIEEIESKPNTEIRKLLVYSLPRLADRLKTSEELIQKGENFKNEVLESELAESFTNKMLSELREFLISYSSQPGEVLKEKIESILGNLIDGILAEAYVRDKVNTIVKNGIISVICTYKEEIAKLIRHTVEEWEEEDMVNKLELHVGADLQFIRINGTVIGGLAGLAIHLISTVF